MAKSRSQIWQILRGIIFAFLLIVVGLIATFYFWIHYLPENVRIVTTHLPSLDRVEVELVHVHFETINKVIATKTLVGPETMDLATIWRNQNYIYGPEVNCHTPGYRIRFYEQDKLLTEATICFHCHNIYFYKYNGSTTQNAPLDVNFGAFMRDADDSQSAKLRAYLANLFPGHSPDVESTDSPN